MLCRNNLTIEAGQDIEKGQILRTLYDYFGNELSVVRASQAVFALYGLAALR